MIVDSELLLRFHVSHGVCGGVRPESWPTSNAESEEIILIIVVEVR